MSTPNQIGQYRLKDLISVGQTSQLWYAYDEKERQFVALKMLLDKYHRDSSQIASLKWELKVSEDLKNDRTIKIFHYNRLEKIPFLVMEWFPAPNLKMILKEGYAVYAAHIRDMLLLMVESLAELHKKKWVHNDVKPDNFLYDPEDRTLKVLDFALTKKAASGLGKIFSFGRKAQGTPSYISSEQILRKPITESTDVYSLGCTFFEVLTGKLPYTGTSLNELLQKHISGAIPPVTARNRNLTPEMVKLLNAMMTKRPADRPKSCVELHEYLQKIRIFKRNPSGDDIT